jgi:hypothetical protein
MSKELFVFQRFFGSAKVLRSLCANERFWCQPGLIVIWSKNIGAINAIEACQNSEYIGIKAY